MLPITLLSPASVFLIVQHALPLPSPLHHTVMGGYSMGWSGYSMEFCTIMASVLTNLFSNSYSMVLPTIMVSI